jgi:putative acetyltransferase
LSARARPRHQDESSDVSLTTQPFFRAFGFTIVERRTAVVRGVALENALMRKQLAASD